ncbi:MAG TPA: serine/threonine-protein kinase [Kofleriaceae bacterium]|nr:serine/threonine-protein kinase [Kofleriaceae bacterium]
MLGVSIGNYKIVEKIGQGGVGEVYRAVHDMLGRATAVKILLPATSDSYEMILRLFNEARSASSIRHPGIVEVYDFGFLHDQTAYIIMELLEGETLGAMLRREQRVPYARAIDIARSVAETLHAAHEQGIVHRDLKPANIFLVPDPDAPGGERVKLLDFGMAKLGLADMDESLTRTGVVLGTPPYMSPEQCRDASVIDRRSDLYALGCVLYKLLCGRPPFVCASAGEVIAHHLYFPPEPPCIHDELIPRALENLVMWLLQKDPDRRPATAAHVVAALDALGPATGAPASGPGRPRWSGETKTLPMISASTPPPPAAGPRRSRRTTCPLRRDRRSRRGHEPRR